MLIDILIPTYNRAKDLVKNLKITEQLLTNEKLLDKCQIIVIDNCSTDSTQEDVLAFKAENKHVALYYDRNTENIGLERNVVKTLATATSDHVLFVGDDDFLVEGYLTYCIQKVTENRELGCIIPGIAALYEDGSLQNGRNESFDEKLFPAGYDTMYQYSHFGHSMAGLLLKRDHLEAQYEAIGENRNIYLFVYFVTNRLMQYPFLYAPKFKIQVTAFNAKDWSYNEVGLLDVVYKNYYSYLEELGEEKVGDLMIRFTMMHSFRLAIKRGSPLVLYKKYKKLKQLKPHIAGFGSKLRTLLIKEYLLKLKG
ncbi:MAG: glycosyltransferase family 2 protein [Aureispira sp.]|nr:glycosyltransferase family 2 protein [Aureispira sp.]